MTGLIFEYRGALNKFGWWKTRGNEMKGADAPFAKPKYLVSTTAINNFNLNYPCTELGIPFIFSAVCSVVYEIRLSYCNYVGKIRCIQAMPWPSTLFLWRHFNMFTRRHLYSFDWVWRVCVCVRSIQIYFACFGIDVNQHYQSIDVTGECMQFRQLSD